MRVSSTRRAAIDTVKIAGCVISVRRSWSSGPSKQRVESLYPSVSSASSNVWRATGYFSAKSLPIPTACEPCPGNNNAIVFSVMNVIEFLSSERAFTRRICATRGHSIGPSLCRMTMPKDPSALHSADWSWPHRRQPTLNRSINPTLRKFRSHAYCILDRVRVRRAMRDDARALHPQQRRAAVFSVIEPLLEIGEGTARQQRAYLSRNRSLQRFLQRRAHQVRHALRNLQCD